MLTARQLVAKEKLVQHDAKDIRTSGLIIRMSFSKSFSKLLLSLLHYREAEIYITSHTIMPISTTTPKAN
jgi:hypothetical protein